MCVQKDGEAIVGRQGGVSSTPYPSTRVNRHDVSGLRVG